jgi:hypothetical protein
MQELGNEVVAAGRELLFSAEAAGAAMYNTSYFQYMLHNIPESLFSGYAWSLDVFVDYTLRDLASLSSIIIVMMVVEVCAAICSVLQRYRCRFILRSLLLLMLQLASMLFDS